MTVIDHCEFPDDLLYDYDGNSWVRIDQERTEITVGVTSLLVGIAGRLVMIKLKDVGTDVLRGRSLGTIESHRMVGPLPSPLTGTVFARNDKAVLRPKIINDSPYLEGWIVKLKPSDLEREYGKLLNMETARPLLRQRVVEHRVRCFKLFPDHEMVEIGSECAAVLVRLNELIVKLPVGDVIHIVSDDPTSYVEMVAWSDQSGQELVEHRIEGSLQHFLIRKTKS